jgi:hypothetical protein
MLDQFNLEIEKRALAEGSFKEAVLTFSEEKEMEVEEVYDLLNPIIKEKLKNEFILNNYIPALKIETKLENFFKD